MPRIMLVDDELYVVKMLENLLKASFECETVLKHTVDEAEEYLAENQVDLIVLDINMHGASSLGFVADLQAHPQRKSIPVVMLSAMFSDEVKQAFMSRGVKAFFSKEEVIATADRQKFIDTLKSLCAGK